MTPGGVRVRNVAQPVIRKAYAVYCMETATSAALAGVARSGGLAP
jgi:hypothetical protein